MTTQAPPTGSSVEGPLPVPGVPTTIAPGVVRLTAPNPSMMTGPGTNTYLLGDRSLLIIDPGPDDPAHRRRLVEVIAGRTVDAIAVTHTHPDHAPGAARLGRVVDAPLLGFAPGPSFRPDRLLVDGEVLASSDLAVRVLHTPGHASDHCCFLLEGEGMVFTGDHVMEGSTVVIRPPDGDMGTYLASLERLASLDPAPRSLAPGHGRVIEDPATALAELVAHRRQRETLIAEALESHGPSSAAGLRPLVYPGLDEARHDIAAATIWAHLRHLVEQGRASLNDGQLGTEAPDAIFATA